MTAHFKPYGHALCPSCNGDVNLNQKLYGFNAPVTRGSHEILYYFLCAKCGVKLNKLNKTKNEDFSRKIIIATTEKWFKGNKTHYAATTLTALIANGFVLSDAIEFGVPLPKALYDKIVFGEINPYEIAPLLKCLAFNRKSLEGENDN